MNLSRPDNGTLRSRDEASYTENDLDLATIGVQTPGPSSADFSQEHSTIAPDAVTVNHSSRPLIIDVLLHYMRNRLRNDARTMAWPLSGAGLSGPSWGSMAEGGDPAQNVVPLAMCLGWRLAELYDSKELPGPPSEMTEQLPPHLPGLGEMTPHERARALAAHVGADLVLLGKSLGADLPDAGELLAALDTPDHARDDVRSVILRLHRDLRDRLAGVHVAAAIGLGLGRMLADTAFLVASGDPNALGDQFDRYRLANAFAWLDDLDARLPARSAAAVRASLREWERWVAAQRRPDGTVDPAAASEPTVRVLRRQGDLWRRLLAGEQAADQLLDGQAYAGAAAGLLTNGRRIAFHYLWKWSWAIILAIAAAGTAIWAAVTYAPAGTDRVTAVLVSAAGFLGVSWAGTRATLGRALQRAEHAIWDAEVVAAIGKAATIIPQQKGTGERR